MTTAFTYSVSQGGLAVAADLIVVLVTPADLKREPQAEETTTLVHPAVDQALRDSYERSLFAAKPQEVQLIPTLGNLPAPYVAFIGFEDGSVSPTALREAAAAAAKAAARLKAAKVQIRVRQDIVDGPGCLEPQQAAQVFTEGFLLGQHRRKTAKQDAKAPFVTESVEWVLPSTDAEDISGKWERGIQRGKIFAEGTIFARNLTNLPGNQLTPEGLAEEAERLAERLELEIEVLDEWSAAEQGMGGLLAIGQGSINPPRMIIIHYKGNPQSDETWGLVGKGITFDTGGISLKKAEGMEEMISDMGGAAAVLGALQIIGELKPSINVIAVIPSAENMPSDRAVKPGDVITTMSGRTIEIINTDAEGRVVLADGLTAAIKRGATKLIDVATLTGAVMVALGDVATGAVTNDESLAQQVIEAGHRAGERIWPLPNYPEYKKQLHSDVADLKNIGGKLAGTITGGLFIGTFAEEKPWVHLDIGGTAWLEKERGVTTKGATGVMVRTLAELLV
ncbi:leucyl aminopeptidase [Paenibacillus sp. GCM10012307]|uniref:leucyl aminopeptidase n=1 Tax=Paenibacillus TaxID=44249 RepID=UPI002FCE34B8